MLLRVKIAFLFISFQLREHSKTGLGHKLTVSDTSFAPCKGIQDGLGFWIPCCGFRIPDSSTVDSGFQKELDSIFLPVLMLFFAVRFRVRILLYWKTLLEGITSLFSFSIYKITGRNALQFRKGLWYNNEGDIGGLSLPQHRRKK